MYMVVCGFPLSYELLYSTENDAASMAAAQEQQQEQRFFTQVLELHVKCEHAIGRLRAMHVAHIPLAAH
jgi:hypothetical protein